jgi:hypothetical protein
LYFLPLPQGHLSLRPILLGFWVAKVRFSWHWTQVQAWGCSAYQLGLTIFHLIGFGAAAISLGLEFGSNARYKKGGPNFSRGVRTIVA